jgi:hypothetical protein
MITFELGAIQIIRDLIGDTLAIPPPKYYVLFEWPIIYDDAELGDYRFKIFTR